MSARWHHAINHLVDNRLTATWFNAASAPLPPQYSTSLDIARWQNLRSRSAYFFVTWAGIHYLPARGDRREQNTYPAFAHAIGRQDTLGVRGQLQNIGTGWPAAALRGRGGRACQARDAAHDGSGRVGAWAAAAGLGHD